MTFITKLILSIALLTTLLLEGCSVSQPHRDGPPRHAFNVRHVRPAIPKYEPKSHYGNPRSYVALGKRYYVLPTARGYDKRGIASWYGRKFNGQLTSNREHYNMLAMTAASPTLPIPCYVQVTNLENGRSEIVRVNDRGPFAPNRIIDLSYAAAIKLGYAHKGTALVEVKAINPRNPNQTTPTRITKSAHLYLQVGAFSQYNNARHLKQQLATYTHKKIRITKATSHHHPIYRVRIGPLRGVNESDTLFNKLHRHGLNKAVTVIG